MKDDSESSSSWTPSSDGEQGQSLLISQELPSVATACAAEYDAIEKSPQAVAAVCAAEHGAIEENCQAAAARVAEFGVNADSVHAALTSPSELHATQGAPHQDCFKNTQKKRTYNYRTRVPATTKAKEPRRKTWEANLASTSRASLKRQVCCKSLRCFSRVDYDHFIDTKRMLIAAPTSVRRTVLKSFRGSDGTYRFDSHPVCVVFLKEGFHFSTVMIAEVSSGVVRRPAYVPKSAQSAINIMRSDNSTALSSVPTSSESPIEGTPKRKEAIVSFLLRVAEDCGDSMPHRNEIHLPFLQVQDVYKVFSNEFKRLYPSAENVATDYFRRMWLLHCRHIKIMKSTRFTICDICDSLRTQLRNQVINGQSTEETKLKKKLHIDFVKAERMEYQKKKDRARLNSSEYLSVIVDGADQSSFGLPHFTTTPKSQRGHSLKVKLVGLLEHRLQVRLFLYTMTQDHETGANHVIEALHRFLLTKRMEGPLPRKLFIQLDNCSRENKNRYVMGYLEMLVSACVFDSVECGFLPVGHTHEDVDQAFSSTSSRLRTHDAITLADLHRELRQTYSGNVKVEHMKRIVNWSGLCDAQRYLRRVDGITFWRYFLFTSTQSNAASTAPDTRCSILSVKKDADSSWQSLLPTNKDTGSNGILRSHPDLSLTPPLKITCPDGVNEINKRFCSEEERINDADKLIELHDLRDFVFQSREDPFHWDLEQCVETEHKRPAPGILPTITTAGTDEIWAEPQTQETTEHRPYTAITPTEAKRTEAVARHPTAVTSTQTQTTPHTRVDYHVGSFVIVQHADDDGERREATEAVTEKFWVAKVLGVTKNPSNNYVTKLRVQWFDRESYGEESITALQESNSPSFKTHQQANS